MSAPYLGEIRAVGFTFAPVGWVACNGQPLAINQYEALYSLIGTTYGGDGVNSFNVPSLGSRIVPGSEGGAPGPGLSPYQLGQTGGLEQVTLTANQLPAHAHPFTSQLSTTTTGNATNTPAGNLPGGGSRAGYNSAPTAGRALAPNAVAGTTQPAGGNQPHPNVQPVLALNYIICTEGIYPPRP